MPEDQKKKTVGECRRCGDPIYADQFHVCKGSEADAKAKGPPAMSGNAGPAPAAPANAPPAAKAAGPPPAKKPPPQRRPASADRHAMDQDTDKRITALGKLVREFPALEKLRDLYAADRRAFWIAYEPEVLKAAAEALKIPLAGVEMPKGHVRPYVNYAGLLHKTQTDPRRVMLIKTVPVLYPFGVKVLNEPVDEDWRRFFVGCSEDEMAVFQGIVRFQDGSEFLAQGTASPRNISMGTLRHYLIEMADTRSICRTMRRATGVGLLSVEELQERGISRPTTELSRTESREASRIRDAVRECFFRLKMNPAQQLAVCRNEAGVSEVMEATPEGARKLLAALETEEKKRKETTHGKRRSAGAGKGREAADRGLATEKQTGSGNESPDRETEKAPVPATAGTP